MRGAAPQRKRRPARPPFLHPAVAPLRAGHAAKEAAARPPRAHTTVIANALSR
ncbi:hypothetical protein BURPS1106B_A0332 [Burkholderia pseudomallei 1106b]|uniref:Uncharacterized protein n=1 Tax=Burkholderia pseudomallei (strain 1106a) TaxID=357348 RepID=A3NSN9_BURP0|nr:hypothetical protein BURPS1106A_1079 [Burkholderia pseudomallei 1106a]AFR14956.1 hypothetical protein BPC006_I1070 [Burkholderia pseudomallei BPC006]EES24449.1 hypothetical protein BURPS1106B_A0332 [Burkholderia pseudomallei 1106b]